MTIKNIQNETIMDTNDPNILLSTLKNQHDIIYSLDVNHRHTAVYGSWLNNEKINPEMFLGKTAIEIMGEEKGRIHIESNKRVLSGESVNYEWSYNFDGTIEYVQTSLSPIFGNNSNVIGILGIGRNITKLQRANIEIKKLHRARKMISEFNRMLVRIDSIEELSKALVENIVETGGYHLAWTGKLIDGKLIPISKHGYDEKFLDSITHDLENINCAEFPAGIAIRSRKLFISRNSKKENLSSTFIEEAEKRNFRSTAAFPIIIKGKMFGVVVIYSNAEDSFENPEEINILTEMIDDFTFGITSNIKDEELSVFRKAIEYRERVFSKIFNESAVGISMLSLDGKIILTNSSFEEILECTGEIINGKLLADFIEKSQTDKLVEKMKKLEKDEINLISDDYQLTSCSGKKIWVRLHLSKISFSDSDESQFICQILDVTSNINAARKLKEEEERFKALYDLSKMEFEDEKEVIQFAVDKAVNITESDIGYIHFVEEDQMNLNLLVWSKSVMEICNTDIPKNYLLKNAGMWADALRQRKPVIHNNYMEIEQKGELPEWHIQLKNHMNVPIFEHDKVVAIAGVGNKDTDYDDYDAQKLTIFINEMWQIISKGRSANQLRKFKEAVSQSLSGIVITDINGVIEYVNPSYCETTGYSLNELVGEKSSKLQSGVMKKNEYKKLWDTILSGKSWIGEFRNKKKDGTLFWENAIISPIFNENSEIDNFVAVKDDITEQKKLNEELIIAKKNAEAASSLKSLFLSQISHEIRTPLNTILNFSNLLQEELTVCSSSFDLNDSISAIKSGSHRISRTIDLILNVAQLKTGTYEMKFEMVDLSKVLSDIHLNFLDEAKIKGLDYELNLFSKNTIIFADSFAVSQIFSHLLDNAIKFTTDGYVKVNLFNGTKNLTAQIIDSGIGVEKKYLKKIFDTFSQEEMGYSRRYDGNGLGMALVKGLCDLNNIKIGIESEKDNGTIITLVLPKLKNASFPSKKPYRDNNAPS
ncbi:MAG: PAS domain S-box protein [Melioribacteraceae bacterium]|nr:PAS domain S-box protein [Melioribacteraceae bacterium]MCF8395827.1 PAS domain S-box protein [Melioribacteraceae bacterium]MCF8420921.1 PAS domain S-box protein [Melioribacteraceae bacterium]